MKCIDLINDIKSRARREIDPQKTCDTVKCGDPQRELTKAAVTMFATPDVVREAVAWGAQLLIVHEPVFYDHMDKNLDTAIAEKKKKFVEDSGLVIFRFHDYAHAMSPDLIYEGEINALGLEGRCTGSSEYGKFGINNFTLDNEITALELAKIVEEKLRIRHVRIAGNPQAKGRKISCCFGSPGHLESELANNDFLLAGEICEWRVGEMARDYAQFGYNKAVLVLSHEASEREGMALLCKKLAADYPETEFRYIESGEVYSYVD